MGQILHGSATRTEAVRRAIGPSTDSTLDLGSVAPVGRSETHLRFFLLDTSGKSLKHAFFGNFLVISTLDGVCSGLSGGRHMAAEQRLKVLMQDEAGEDEAQMAQHETEQPDNAC